MNGGLNGRELMDVREKLIETFYQHKDAGQAIPMAAYMKNKFAFLGIPKPQRAALQRPFFQQAKKDAAIDWDFVFALWDLPEREFQYCAVDYLSARVELLEKGDLDKIGALILKKSWWDTVDALAAHVAGALCREYPALIGSHMLVWAEAENIWLARTAILFQVKYKDKTDTEILSRIICRNSDTKEFFLNKAIGWVLREYSKINNEWVKAFIAGHSLHPLSKREAGKYIR